MREESPGRASAEGAPSGQETIVRKLRYRKYALLAALSSGGGCLAISLALSDHGLKLGPVKPLPILEEWAEIAVSVLLAAAVITVVIAAMLVLWCLLAAVRNVGDQGMANRWLDLATRAVYRHATVDSHCAVRAARPAGSWSGQNCTIVLIDIANFGARTRNDRDRRRIRAVLYQISQSLFEHLDWQHDYHREDRGDGILLVVPPHVPTSSIVDRILDDLVTLLRRHNNTAALATRIQMRVALHVGPVVSDAYGVDGRAIIQAARLLDAPALRRHLAETGADLGFITSPFVYDTIIQPNPGPVDPAAYQQLKCRVKKQALNAWMYLTQTSGEIRPAAAKVGQISRLSAAPSSRSSAR